MNSETLRSRIVCAASAAASLLLLAGPLVHGEETVATPAPCAAPTSDPGPGTHGSVGFPDEALFARLLADPKEPHFYATFLRTRAAATERSANIASVGFGEEFGVWGARSGADGWQVSLQAGVLAQLHLDPSTSYALINADYIVGIPVTWRRERVSARARLYHQSSHVGDEYLLLNPDAERINISFEELEAVVAYDIGEGHGRAYAGGGWLVQRHPAMNRYKALAGLEWRGRSHRSTFDQRHQLKSTPVAGVELKSFGELDWKVNVRVLAGVELARERGTRGLRLLAEYYHGYFPYGQFYKERIDHFGIGLHLAF